MDNWDEKKLEEVVNKKHGEAEKKKPKTQIVCPFFFFNWAVIETIICILVLIYLLLSRDFEWNVINNILSID